MCQGTVENWCADDDVNMAVRAGGNIEYGREPDFEGWIRWRQQEKMQQIVTGKATLEQPWQACWRGFVLLLLWAGSTVVGFAQLQSINYKVCKYFKVAKVTKSSARTNKTDAIGAVIIWRTAWRESGAYQHNWQMQRVSPHSCSVQCQPPGKTTTLQQPAQQHYHWSKLTGKN